MFGFFCAVGSPHICSLEAALRSSIWFLMALSFNWVFLCSGLPHICSLEVALRSYSSHRQMALGGCNFSKSKSPPKYPFLPLSGAQRGAVESHTCPKERWCGVLKGTALGDGKGPPKKS